MEFVTCDPFAVIDVLLPKATHMLTPNAVIESFECTQQYSIT